MTRKSIVARFVSLAAIAALGLAFVSSAQAGKGGSGPAGSGCSISPGQAVLDQSWIVSAWGLPTNSTVNMIITFPDGGRATGPITATNGTFMTTGNSNMSASWGFIAPEQKGTYSYQFVGRVKWPAGTFTRSYGQCVVVVS
jgi:hypothetical protein